MDGRLRLATSIVPTLQRRVYLNRMGGTGHDYGWLHGHIAQHAYWLPSKESDAWLEPPADPSQSVTLYLVASRKPRKDIADILRRTSTGYAFYPATPIEQYSPLMGVKRVRGDRYSLIFAAANLAGVQVTRRVQDGTDFAWRWRMQ